MYQEFQYHDIVYSDRALGWVDGVYHPRVPKCGEGSSFLEVQDGLLKLHSRVWREVEETGYGTYYYEETTQFVTNLPGSNYVVQAVLVNPAPTPCVCHIRLNGVVKKDNIMVGPGEEYSVTLMACMTDGRFALSFPVGTMGEISEEVIEGDVYLKEIDISPAPARRKREKPHIFLVSDSTVQSYEKRSYPQTGWGQVLCEFFRGAEQCLTGVVKCNGQKVGKSYELPDLVIENRAIAGRSARSFYDEGRLDQIMEELCPGDYMLVQFAHNDDNALRPNRYIAPEEFPIFLKRYLDACERRGAQCVFVTPVTMMVTGEDGRFKIAFHNYREKMIELAQEYHVPLLDLGERSTAYLNEIGMEKSKQIYLWAKEGEYPDSTYAGGVSDRAHLQEYGARIYASFVVKLIMDYSADDKLDTLKKLAVPKETDEIEKRRNVMHNASTMESGEVIHNSSTVESGEVMRDAFTVLSGNAACDASKKVTGFVAQEIAVENGGRGSFLLNWNHLEGATAYNIYARKQGDTDFKKVKTITKEEKDAHATLPFSVQAGVVWEYCVRAVFKNGMEGQNSRVIEVDLC